MKLKTLYFSHTIKNPNCPICGRFINYYCKCGFHKFYSGFNLQTNTETYTFDFKNNYYSFPIDSFSSYKEVLLHIHKLEIFK